MNVKLQLALKFNIIKFQVIEKHVIMEEGHSLDRLPLVVLDKEKFTWSTPFCHSSIFTCYRLPFVLALKDNNLPSSEPGSTCFWASRFRIH
jgi:hypothetical protein